MEQGSLIRFDKRMTLILSSAVSLKCLQWDQVFFCLRGKTRAGLWLLWTLSVCLCVCGCLSVSLLCVFLSLSLSHEWVKSLSRVQLFATPWTVAHQAPPSMGFSRQEHWSGLPFPSPGDLPTQGSNSGLPHCRQTHYHLSHRGSPHTFTHTLIKAYVCICVPTRTCIPARTVARSCPTLCDSMDCSPPGSSVHGISQPEYPSRDLPDPVIKSTSPAASALASRFFTSEPPEKPMYMHKVV